jgi:hypothetical protein
LIEECNHQNENKKLEKCFHGISKLNILNKVYELILRHGKHFRVAEKI